MSDDTTLREKCERMLREHPGVPGQTKTEISLSVTDVLALMDRLHECRELKHAAVKLGLQAAEDAERTEVRCTTLRRERDEAREALTQAQGELAACRETERGLFEGGLPNREELAGMVDRGEIG